MADASIPLQFHNPTLESPADAQARALNLQRLTQDTQQQAQLGPEHIRAAQMENQQRKIQMEQAAAVRKAYQDAMTIGPDGRTSVDSDKLTKALASGGHGDAIPGILKGMNDFQKSTAEVAELNAKVANAQADYGGIVGTVSKAAGYDPHLFLTKAQQAVAAKAVKPEEVQPLIQAVEAALQQDPTGESARGIVRQISDHLIAASPAQTKLTNEGLTAQGAAQRGEAATAAAKLNREKWNVESKGAEAKANAEYRQNVVAQLATAPNPAAYNQILNDSSVPHGIVPAAEQVFDPSGKPIPESITRLRQLGMSPDQQAVTAGQAEAREQAKVPKTEVELAIAAKDPKRTPEERRAADEELRRLDASKVAARPVVNITNVPGLGQGQAGAVSQASGEDFLKTLPAGTAAQVRAIAEGRASIPSASSRSQGALQLRDALFKYDPTFSEQRAQVRKAFTAGTDGKNIGALNTATVHLDQLADVATALQNGSFRPGNELWNAVRSTFGSATPSNFNGLKAAVAGEMATALKGNATDTEIHTISSTISAAGSPAQLRGIIATNLHTLGAKLNTYQERYSQQIPGDKVYSPVLPSARAVYEKHGINPTAGPGAKAEDVAPPMPSTLTASDKGKTFTNRDGQKIKVTEINPDNPKQFKFEPVK